MECLKRSESNQWVLAHRIVGCPTQRELQCLQGVAVGQTTNEIAQTLSISERTVDHHIGSVMRKLDAPTRAAAVARGLLTGLIEIELG